MSAKVLCILFASATAVFWGLYGPLLGKARGPEWSPFKPYVFIGVAYLVWGVLAGLVAMYLLRDSFSFTGKYAPAMKWGFIAGSLGAFGALTLTFAMFEVAKAKIPGGAGLVMPIVFGGAVSVTALTSLVLLRVFEEQTVHTQPQLWIGMALVAAGIVMVAKYTPHAAPKPAGTQTGSAHAAQTQVDPQNAS